MRTFGKDLLLALFKLFYLRFCISSGQEKTVYQNLYQQFERFFYKKAMIAMVPTTVATNLLLFLFFLIVETRNNDQIFNKLGVW